MKSDKKNNDSTKENKRTFENIQADIHRKEILIMHLQSQNGALNKKYYELKEEYQSSKDRMSNQIDNLSFNKMILEERNQEILMMKRQLEMKCDTLHLKNQSLTFQYQSYRTSKQIEVQEIKKKMSQDKKQYDTISTTYHHAIESFNKVEEDNKKMKKVIDQERLANRMHLADLQRDRMITIDNIKKQMIQTAFDMRSKALEIRKQQLDTTTRLTFLQNDQLIRELEYQSKNTEKILSNNRELEKKIKELKHKIDIHEQVEKQLAKKHKVAKGLIENLMKQKNNEEDDKNHQHLYSSKLIKKDKISYTSELEMREQLEFHREVVNRLEKAHHETEKKYQKLKKQYDDHKYNEDMRKEKNKYLLDSCENIALILVRFYDQLLSEENMTQKETEEYDIDILKQKPVEKWSNQEINKTVKILLSLLQPYLSIKTLSLPYFKEKKNKLDIAREQQTLKKKEKIMSILQNRRNLSEKHRSLTNSRPLPSHSEIQTTKQKAPSRYHYKYNPDRTIKSIAMRFLKQK